MRVVSQTNTGGGSKMSVARGPSVSGEGTGNECECSITGEEIYAKLGEAGYINQVKFVDPEALKECIQKYMKEDKALQMFMAYNDELKNTACRFIITAEDLQRAITGATMTIEGCIQIIEEASRDLGDPVD